MTALTPRHPHPPVRVVRIWPNRALAQVRIEYDQQPDGSFRGLWLRRDNLRVNLTRLLPELTDAELDDIENTCDALPSPAQSPQFLEIQHRSQEVTLATPEIHDFSW